MTHYIAIFSNDIMLERKNSIREYAAAWMIGVAIPGHEVKIRKGFAKTRELAAKAMMSESAIDRTGKYKGRKLHEPGVIVFQEITDAKIVKKGK
jgi:phosphoglucomutase